MVSSARTAPGKATLIKFLSGSVPASAGTIEWKGGAVAWSTAKDANHMGVATIHQHIPPVPTLSALQKRRPRGAQGTPPLEGRGTAVPGAVRPGSGPGGPRGARRRPARRPAPGGIDPPGPRHGRGTDRHERTHRIARGRRARTGLPDRPPPLEGRTQGDPVCLALPRRGDRPDRPRRRPARRQGRACGQYGGSRRETPRRSHRRPPDRRDGSDRAGRKRSACPQAGTNRP